MSQESISFFEDKTTEQIINWMIAHLSESQLRGCLESAKITPTYSAGPSSAGAGSSSDPLPPVPSVPPIPATGPSSTGAGSSSDPLPSFTPPTGIAPTPSALPVFDVSPYQDTEMSTRQINPITPDKLNELVKYIGYQVESKEDIKRVFPVVEDIGLTAIPVYVYSYEKPIVYFIGFAVGPTGLYVVPFQAATLKTFKQIGFELLRSLDKSLLDGSFSLPPGKTITKEMQRVAKAYALANNKPDIIKNTLKILDPDYLKNVVRPEIERRKAAKFGFTENYNNGGELFEDLTSDTLDYNEFGNYTEDTLNENENENEEDTDYAGTESDYTSTENGTEQDLSEPSEVKSNIRVYDMTPEQRKEHMKNKFGEKFSEEFTAESYINSQGKPGVKYIRNGNIYKEREYEGPIIGGFGEESEEENLF